MWESLKLGDICDLQNGFAFKSKDYVENSNTLNIRMSNIRPNGNFDPLHNVKYLPDNYSDTYASYKLFDGDLIIAMTDMAGDPKILGKPTLVEGVGERTFLLNQRVGKLHSFSEKVFVPFLSYFLSSLKDYYKSLGAGGLQINISKKDILSAEIKLPPLAEQQRIVAKLDAAFAEIDVAVNYSKQNVANVERLYSFGIDEVFSPMYNLAQPLGNNSEINYGYTAKASFNEGTHKFLRITDIQDNSVDWDGVPFCNIEDTKLPKMLLHDGDIVFARTGATTGKSFLVENPMDAVFASYLIRVSVDRDILLPRYVMHFFQSETYWLQVKEGISGAAQGGFNASKLAELAVPVIPIEEQKNVIDRLDMLYEQATQLASIYEKKLEQQIALKSAILAQELQSEAA